MASTYSETRSDLRWIADELEDLELTYKIYNYGVQYNVEDLNGIIHSYYPTTGTMLFHASNDRNDRRSKVIRDASFEEFVSYVTEPERIQELFKERK